MQALTYGRSNWLFGMKDDELEWPGRVPCTGGGSRSDKKARHADSIDTKTSDSNARSCAGTDIIGLVRSEAEYE